MNRPLENQAVEISSLSQGDEAANVIRRQVRAQSDLEDLNASWSNDRVAAVGKAIQLQQRFTVLQRWMKTLHELQFQLEN